MRISDWSSDVCSSDLSLVSFFSSDKPKFNRAEFLETNGLSIYEKEEDLKSSSGLITSSSVPFGTQSDPFSELYDYRPPPLESDNLRLAEKIGRASCGESVCQYV